MDMHCSSYSLYSLMHLFTCYNLQQYNGLSPRILFIGHKSKRQVLSLQYITASHHISESEMCFTSMFHLQISCC